MRALLLALWAVPAASFSMVKVPAKASDFPTWRAAHHVAPQMSAQTPKEWSRKEAVGVFAGTLFGLPLAASAMPKGVRNGEAAGQLQLDPARETAPHRFYQASRAASRRGSSTSPARAFGSTSPSRLPCPRASAMASRAASTRGS
eukprot:scaffold171_cov263-Pinguiococcus_pyrenoidosus.AAC.12